MAILDMPATTGETPNGLADELTALAARLQRSTVQVRGEGPGGGSGVIWSPDGLIITNAHVARGSRGTVELWDGRTFPAQVTSRDERRDLASLRIAASGLPAAEIGDSDALRVGELVLAVGNPLGMVGALTMGIVHAIGPDTTGTAEAQQPVIPRRQTWVQADVTLAPGNSGGLLADARGHVMGINSMINGGLALAVPSNAVARFLAGGGERAYLGVTMQPVLVPLSRGRAIGLMVLEVVPQSPADRAGLIPGDVLIGAGGYLFRSPDSLGAVLYNANPGETIAFDVLHGGRRVTREVTLGRDATDAAQAA